MYCLDHQVSGSVRLTPLAHLHFRPGCLTILRTAEAGKPKAVDGSVQILRYLGGGSIQASALSGSL